MNLHWNYFISLERDLENLSRYIEFTEENYKTFSTELVRLYLATGAEVDVLLKQLCGLVGSEKKVGNIKGYRKIITEHFPEIGKEKVFIKRYNLEIAPWEDWKEEIGKEEPNPRWWTLHNKVKHHRNEAYPSANLKNVIDAIAGLLVLNFYFVKASFPKEMLDCVVFDSINPKPNFFFFDEIKYLDYKNIDIHRRLYGRRF